MTNWPLSRVCGLRKGPVTRIDRKEPRILVVLYLSFGVLLHHEVKTPLDIYLQRHSPLSPDLWLHYSRLSARYISRHVPGADISLYPVSSYLSKWIKPGAK